MTARATILLVACLSAAIVLGLLATEVHHYYEATIECEARCDPYGPDVSVARRPGGTRTCLCCLERVTPDVVHLGRQQALLDSITTEPPADWRVGSAGL